MSSTAKLERPHFPLDVNFVSQGHGSPIILIHGLAASLHDWDQLIPALVANGYATHALDLLGHGDSAKPPFAFYELDWLLDHFVAWLDGMKLDGPAVLVGHSLGGYVALEYARRHPDAVRALVLVDPFYSNGQLPWFLRSAYAHPKLTTLFMSWTPSWLVRWAIDLTSMLMGHTKGGLHALSQPVRAQTTTDYMRTAPAAYGILRREIDLTPFLASIAVPALVVWGERDQTLTPASFLDLVKRLPRAVGTSSATGHVPHQANAEWFTQEVLTFLQTVAEGAAEKEPRGRSVLGSAAGH